DHERRFGTHDRQIDPLALGEGDQPRNIVDCDVDVLHARFQCRAGIPRRDVDGVDARRLRDFPSERMLATAGTDDQYLHLTCSSVHEAVGCRLWPETKSSFCFFSYLQPTAYSLDQWRKCLIPVSTIAMPCSSAAAMTSASRIEPPGWMTALMPNSAATSSPSRNGKKASEAITAPATVNPSSFAFIAAMRLDTTRLI